MASIAITASICRAQSSNLDVHKKQSRCSYLGTTNDSHVIIPSNLEKGGRDERHLNLTRIKQQNQNSNEAKEEVQQKFSDERWKNGTWDLNMFVKLGKMDWDAVIVAEARRRRFLEIHPEAATNQEPVLFRSSVIPWWTWISHSHLPEAELLNGRAAMVGFFMAYFVDALTRIDMVGQTGNFICKGGILATVLGILLFRKRQDFGNLRKLADEATFYDRQWQASWQHQDSSTSTTTSKQGRT